MRLLLFDVDGTLFSGKGAGSRAMTRAGRTVLGNPFSLEGIDFGGALDPWIYAEAARRSGHSNAAEHHEAFREAYLIELARELEAGTPRPAVLPGVLPLLERLTRRSDVTVGLVTGNYRRAVPLKFKTVGLPIEHFTIGAFGDDGETRARLVELALVEWKKAGGSGAPRDAVVIGDTPKDVRCAQDNGCRCFAVATGKNTIDELRAAGADAVTKDLTETAELEDWL